MLQASWMSLSWNRLFSAPRKSPNQKHQCVAGSSDAGKKIVAHSAAISRSSIPFGFSEYGGGSPQSKLGLILPFLTGRSTGIFLSNFREI